MKKLSPSYFASLYRGASREGLAQAVRHADSSARGPAVYYASGVSRRLAAAIALVFPFTFCASPFCDLPIAHPGEHTPAAPPVSPPKAKSVGAAIRPIPLSLLAVPDVEALVSAFGTLGFHVDLHVVRANGERLTSLDTATVNEVLRAYESMRRNLRPTIDALASVVSGVVQALYPDGRTDHPHDADAVAEVVSVLDAHGLVPADR